MRSDELLRAVIILIMFSFWTFRPTDMALWHASLLLGLCRIQRDTSGIIRRMICSKIRILFQSVAHSLSRSVGSDGFSVHCGCLIRINPPPVGYDPDHDLYVGTSSRGRGASGPSCLEMEVSCDRSPGAPVALAGE